MQKFLNVYYLLENIPIVNKCFDVSARKMGILTNVINFPELSLHAMKMLQDVVKSNSVYNLSKIVDEIMCLVH